MNEPHRDSVTSPHLSHPAFVSALMCCLCLLHAGQIGDIAVLHKGDIVVSVVLSTATVQLSRHVSLAAGSCASQAFHISASTDAAAAAGGGRLFPLWILSRVFLCACACVYLYCTSTGAGHWGQPAVHPSQDLAHNTHH
jgi:hypothetical protein